MQKKVFPAILALFFHFIHATQPYPSDVCFMVADLKYNQRQGVKICEIQQGCLSLFNGDKFRSPQENSIHTNFLNALSLYNPHGWVVADSIKDKNLVFTLANSSFWKSPKNTLELFSDPDFIYQATIPTCDSYDLSSYQGFLYISWSQLRTIDDFEKKFPGVMILDKASFPFWIDKYKMTQLFAEDEQLRTFKPKWGHYKKKYTKELAPQIARDLQCNLFVIKPRGEFLGKDVIITSRKNLDEVLSYIITLRGKYASSQDPAYTSWKKDPFDSFIVEEFVASDPIRIAHLGDKTYQPTMRVAFLLVYDRQGHHVHFLGGYWKTPALSLDEEGAFMPKNKDICTPPYYCAVDPQTMTVVEDELRVALPLLHSKMLQHSSQEEEN